MNSRQKKSRTWSRAAVSLKTLKQVVHSGWKALVSLACSRSASALGNDRFQAGSGHRKAGQVSTVAMYSLFNPKMSLSLLEHAGGKLYVPISSPHLWPPGEMASRLTTNQEIAGSTPAVVIIFLNFIFRSSSHFLTPHVLQLHTLLCSSFYYLIIFDQAKRTLQ